MKGEEEEEEGRERERSSELMKGKERVEEKERRNDGKESVSLSVYLSYILSSLTTSVISRKSIHEPMSQPHTRMQPLTATAALSPYRVRRSSVHEHPFSSRTPPSSLSWLGIMTWK